MSSNYTKTGKAINLQGENALAIQATDSTAVLYEPGVLYVAYGGTVVLLPYGVSDTTVNTGAVTFGNVQNGTILPVLARRVIATGSTGTGFVLIY
jgi:hypothetical protein